MIHEGTLAVGVRSARRYVKMLGQPHSIVVVPTHWQASLVCTVSPWVVPDWQLGLHGSNQREMRSQERIGPDVIVCTS